MVRPIHAQEINAYLKEISGAEITAKDLRMLAANALAAQEFAAMEPETVETRQRRQIAAVMRKVAERLGNTPAVTRKSYVHSRIVEAFAAGGLPAIVKTCRSVGLRKRSESLVKRLIAS